MFTECYPELVDGLSWNGDPACMLRCVDSEADLTPGEYPRNSHTPSSAERYTKPVPKSLRTQSGRKPGKQRGGDGAALAQVDEPDHRLTHRPESCAGCGASLDGADVVSVERRQVFDRPVTLVEVTEHRVEHRRCPCGSTTAATAPAGVDAPTQYGPKVRAAGRYLTAGQLLPYKRAAETMADLLGAPVCPGSLHAWTDQLHFQTGKLAGVGPGYYADRDQFAQINEQMSGIELWP